MRLASWIIKATDTHGEYFFFTTTLVTRMRVAVTLYVNCMYCCKCRCKVFYEIRSV